MAQITYTDKDKTAAAGTAPRQWRDVDANEVKTVVNGKADVLGDTTSHTGTDWDGTPKYRELTGNLALTLTTTLKSGLFVFKQDGTGGHTLTINTVSIPIEAGAGARSVVQFFWDEAASEYVFIVDAAYGVASGGDITPPTMVSADTEGANQLKAVFDENMSNPTSAGWEIKVNGIARSITNVILSANIMYVFTIDGAAMVGTDAVLISYNSALGNAQDTSGNALASFTDYAVTNDEGGGAGTSYSNTGGTGDRSAIITVTDSGAGPLLASGSSQNLVNGDTAESNTWFNAIDISSSWITFDFGVGASKIIDEAKFYQSAANSHGTWKWQGSDDNSAWTDIGSSFTLGGSATQTITELSGNTTGYRYYRLTGVSGTASTSPYITEFEFKISA